MSHHSSSDAPCEVVYPESDGEPMADNTLMFEWVVKIKVSLDLIFLNHRDVFVAGDLFWYPVEGDNTTRMAPDAMVAFGRPKGHRRSYRQWVEGGIAPQVVFEVRSPRDSLRDMERKSESYFRFGVEEYYEFYPNLLQLRGWIRKDQERREILPMSGWISPRLGIRFELTDDLTIYGPDGRPFLSISERMAGLEKPQKRGDDNWRRADNARREADHHWHRAERLAAQLRALGEVVEE